MNNQVSQLPNQHLVLTALGKNKTGLVSDVTGLVSECQCNIIDSKMAIFGSEFTMIMLLEASPSALANVEAKLPELAMELNLLTMMKRTTKHAGESNPKYLLQLNGPDQAGTIKQITSSLAKQEVNISSLKSKASIVDNQPWQHAQMTIELNDTAQIETVIQKCKQECSSLDIELSFIPLPTEQ